MKQILSANKRKFSALLGLALLVSLQLNCQGRKPNAITAYKIGNAKAAPAPAKAKAFQPLVKPVQVRNSLLIGLSFKEVLQVAELDGLSPYGKHPDKFYFNEKGVTPLEDGQGYVAKVHILQFKHGAVINHEITERVVKLP